MSEKTPSHILIDGSLKKKKKTEKKNYLGNIQATDEFQRESERVANNTLHIT